LGAAFLFRGNPGIKKRQDSEKCGLGVSPSEAPFQDRGVGGEGLAFDEGFTTNGRLRRLDLTDDRGCTNQA
jgi:hypothetical protein